MADASPLLKSTPAWEDQTWWRVTHAGAFILGGVTFWIGTWLYYDPADSLGDLDQAQISAWLYIIGSIGFLYVDVEEFFTFTDDYWLRVNIACSVTGSTLVSAAPRRASRSARSPALLSSAAGSGSVVASREACSRCRASRPGARGGPRHALRAGRPEGRRARPSRRPPSRPPPWSNRAQPRPYWTRRLRKR